MQRDELMLAAMAPAKQKGFHPVHVQKLFFLIDNTLAPEIGGPHFNFAPYDYGPFDAAVYHTLDRLQLDGFVDVSDASPWDPRQYSLTDAGQAKGEAVLDQIEPSVREQIGKLSDFVRSLSFGTLVSAIYKAFPEMKVNSVFRE